MQCAIALEAAGLPGRATTTRLTPAANQAQLRPGRSDFRTPQQVRSEQAMCLRRKGTHRRQDGLEDDARDGRLRCGLRRERAYHRYCSYRERGAKLRQHHRRDDLG